MEIREETDASGKEVSSSVQSLEAMAEEAAEAVRLMALNLKSKIEAKGGTNETKKEASVAPPKKRQEPQLEKVASPKKKEETFDFEAWIARLDELERVEARYDDGVVIERRKSKESKRWQKGFFDKKKAAPPKADFMPVVEGESLTEQKKQPTKKKVTKKVSFEPAATSLPTQSAFVRSVKEKEPGVARKKAGPPVVDMPAQLHSQAAFLPQTRRPATMDEQFDDPDAIDHPPNVSKFRARRMSQQPDTYF